MAKLWTLALLLIFSAALSANPEPFADIHLHFNWDQQEIISADEIVKRLQANNIVLASVSSTPSSLALELAAAGAPWIKPYFTPYITVAHRDRWFLDEQVLRDAEQGLASGRYQGIGELHVWSNMGPPWDNEILVGLIALAESYQVPLLIHTEASSHKFFLPVCQQYPRVRFLWAHAGGRLSPDEVGKLMELCPNVWSEVSVRDPWRYHTLVDDDNTLLPGWKELFIRFQDRFMTGTDPVWSVTRGQRWDQADEGWDHYDKLLQFHREWLKQLPPAVEKKIRLTNALAFFAEQSPSAE